MEDMEKNYSNERRAGMSLGEQIKYWLTHRRGKVFWASVLLSVLFILGSIVEKGSTSNILGELTIEPGQIVLMTVQLFAIIDPVGVLPIYLMYEQDLQSAQKTKLARTVATAMFAILLLFVFLGPLILDALHVTLYSFMLGGGVILMVLAIDMLGEGPRTKTLDAAEAAVVPIASPLLVGPGTLATIMVFVGTRPLIDVLISAIIVTFLVALTLIFASSIAKVMGRNGLRAASRLFGIVIAAMAAQLIHDALLGWGIIHA